MKNVYFLDTQYMYSGWSQLFVELAFHMKEKHGANIVYQKGGHLHIPKYDYHQPDCEIILEDEQEDSLKIITFSEVRTKTWNILCQRNNPKDILLQTQFYSWFPKNFDVSQFNFKIKGTPFYPFVANVNHDYYYYQRKLKSYDSMIDKIFFLFSTLRPDGIQLRELGICSPSPGNLIIQDYLNLAIQHKIGLSAASVAEIAYREIEYMAIGLPNMHLEYMTQLNPPLIPNYHYISVDRSNFPWDANADRNGGPEYVEAYRKRFYEVKDDHEFLDFISRNARAYYEKYCSGENKLKHILSQLEIEDEF